MLETPGEDPFLTTQYAIAFVKGVQGVDTSGRGYIRAASTPKHYASYNLDRCGMDTASRLWAFPPFFAKALPLLVVRHSC